MRWVQRGARTSEQISQTRRHKSTSQIASQPSSPKGAADLSFIEHRQPTYEGGYEGDVDTTLTPPGRNTVQHAATQSRESRLDMRGLQASENLCNAWIITRNEQESGSSPLVGSLYSLH